MGTAQTMRPRWRVTDTGLLCDVEAVFADEVGYDVALDRFEQAKGMALRLMREREAAVHEQIEKVAGLSEQEVTL